MGKCQRWFVWVELALNPFYLAARRLGPLKRFGVVTPDRTPLSLRVNVVCDGEVQSQRVPPPAAAVNSDRWAVPQATQAAAWLASNQHDFTQAEQLFEQSIGIQRALGETGGETQLLFNAALQARTLGHYQQAISLLEEALT